MVNLLVGISSRNMSCVFTRELDREPQQYSTYYLYKVFMVHATTVHCSTLISMPYSHGHYLSTMYLPQGHHAMSMCPDVILLISVDHACTICTLWGTHIPWCHSNPRFFLILLNSKSFQTTLDSSRPMTSYHVTS